MKHSLLLDGEASIVIRQLLTWSDSFGFAIAWASDNDLLRAVVDNGKKLRHGVVGTHFYQTQPAALRQLMALDNAKVVLPNNPLFHPKVWWFMRGKEVRCVVGSHNLTLAAHGGRNTEASALFEPNSPSPFSDDLLNFVKRSWEGAHEIDPDFLASYELQAQAARRHQAALGRFVDLRKANQSKLGRTLLKLDWRGFVARVLADQHHSAKGRLAILGIARELFATKGSLVRMTRDERRAIAGTYGRREPQLGGHDWAWFGTMFGQGDFKNLINEDFQGISAALDHIPLTGDVTEENYIHFVDGFELAFADKKHKGAVATASRLLAMKRPDWFLGVNSANRAKVCEAFGSAPTTLALDNYWRRIVEPLHLSSWWQVDRPSDARQRRIWDNRAALLDSLYYEPV